MFDWSDSTLAERDASPGQRAKAHLPSPPDARDRVVRSRARDRSAHAALARAPSSRPVAERATAQLANGRRAWLDDGSVFSTGTNWARRTYAAASGGDTGRNGRSFDGLRNVRRTWSLPIASSWPQ
jgi:hypothetical protein